MGRSGPYVAARSEEWKEPAHAPRWQVLDSSNQRAYETMKALISALLKDGWELTGERGGRWENRRFRRRLG